MKPEVIYWDSAAFLAHFQEEDGRVEQCEDVLERAQRGEVLIVTSALTLSEVLWMRGEARITREGAQVVQDFFRRSFIRVVNVTRAISELAQELVWFHDIKPKDAIHVASAIHYGIATLETFDRKLLLKSGELAGKTLSIREPQAARQRRLKLGPPATPSIN